jgi:hypothetical protein
VFVEFGFKPNQEEDQGLPKDETAEAEVVL